MKDESIIIEKGRERHLSCQGWCMPGAGGVSERVLQSLETLPCFRVGHKGNTQGAKLAEESWSWMALNARPRRLSVISRAVPLKLLQETIFFLLNSLWPSAFMTSKNVTAVPQCCNSF